MRFFRVLALGFGLLWTACGGAPEAPAEVPTTPAAPPAAPPPPAAPEQAAAPEEVVALGRARNLATLLQNAGQFTGMPLPLEEMLRDDMPALGEVLRLDSSLDVVVALDPDVRAKPEPLVAFSVGLLDFQTALDKARGAGREVEKVSPFLYFVELGKKLRCNIAQDLTTTAPRLVCSPDRRALDLLAPYMATRLPGEELGAGDVRAVIRTGPFRARYGKKANIIKMAVPLALRELAQGQPRFDAALASVLHASADEVIALTHDVDELRLAVTFDPAPEQLRAELELTFLGGKSWTSSVLTKLTAEVSPAPAKFWSLPADALAAGYRAPAAHQALLQPLLQGLSELFAGALEMGKVKPPAVEAWVSAYRQWAIAGGDSVFASGQLPGVDKELAHYELSTSGRDDGAALRFFEASTVVLSDKGLRAYLTERLGVDAKQLPAMKKLPTPAVLPQNAKAYEVAFDWSVLQSLASKAGEGTAAHAPLRRYALLVPAGDTTWVAMGRDLKGLAAKLKEQLSPQPPQATLATRAGLEVFHTRKANIGGFFTAKGLVEAAAESFPLEESQANLPQFVLAAMPNRGETPIHIWLEALSGNGGPAGRVVVTIPKAAAADIAAGATVLAADAAK